MLRTDNAPISVAEQRVGAKEHIGVKYTPKVVLLYDGVKNQWPMKLIAGKPLFEHQVLYLKEQGIEEVIYYGNDEHKIVKSYFGDGSHYGIKIIYVEEAVSRGNAGALKMLEKFIEGSFFIIDGTLLLDMDLKKIYEEHCQSNLLGSMVLTVVDDAKGCHAALMREGRIEQVVESPLGQGHTVNIGMYIFNEKIFARIPQGKKISLETELLPMLAREGTLHGCIPQGHFFPIEHREASEAFKRHFLSRLHISEHQTIREAMQVIDKNKTDLLLVVDTTKRLQGVLNENIIRRFIIEGGSPEHIVSQAMVRNPKIIGYTSQTEEEIQELMKTGTRHLPILDSQGRVHDLYFPKAELKIKSFPIVRGKAPLRISLAGGGTDMPYYFEENGGVVISSTIDKYCYVTAVKRADTKLVINSDLEAEEVVLDIRNLVYDGKFDILKAVINLLKPPFGMELYLNNDIPPGRGLGSSASFSTLLVKTIGELSGESYDNESVAELAYKAEVEKLGIVGGKQDQYAAVFGGFNWIEFSSGDKKIMHPLRIKSETLDELVSHMTLCYTGESHTSQVQQQNQKTTYEQNQLEVSQRLERLKKIAHDIKENLLSVKPNFKKIGELLHESWQYKRHLSAQVSTNNIDRLYECGMEAGAYGGKVLGSGGGGYILFLHPPKVRNLLKRSLEQMGGEVIGFNFENKGLKVWRVDKV